jgi:hypothetical protein
MFYIAARDLHRVRNIGRIGAPGFCMNAETSFMVPVKRPGIGIRRLALPHEHGSWSILLEPLVAGIAVAPSPAAPFVALLFAGGFLMHQPLRLCLTAVKERRMMPHTMTAAGLAFGFLLIAAVGLAGVWSIAGANSLVPLLAAAPLALLQVGYDLASKSRKLVPELAGAVALSTSAAIAASAAGWPATSALALSGVFALRLISSLAYVRNRLLLEKRKASSILWPMIAHGLALGGVVVLAVAGLCPKLVVLAFVTLIVRAAIGLSRWRLKLRAMQIGILEVTFGTLTVLAVVAGYYLHF